MEEDYPDRGVGVHMIPQQVTGEQSNPSRKVETDTRQNFQQLSLHNEQPFHRNESIPTTRSPEEEAQPRAPQTQAQPPQRSESGSSAESDEQLQAALQTAGSNSEKLIIYKKYSKEMRQQNQKLKGENQKLERENQDLKLDVQILTKQLKSTEAEYNKLLQLLDDSEKESTANKRSLKSQVGTLENKVSVLRKALTYASRGEDIPGDIHLQLVQSELTGEELPLSSDTVSTCPFLPLNNHIFFHLLVTNMIQTRGTHCLGCLQKVARIDSHPYSRCILIAAAAHALDMKKKEVEHMQLFWRKDLPKVKGASDPNFYRHATVAKTCTYPVKREAFCGKCDNTTADWERSFSEQFGNPNIEFRDEDITEAILLIEMFRGSILSIDIRHYFECQLCSMYLQEVGETMRDLMLLHRAVCDKQPIAHECKQLKPTVFHNTAIEHRILFPMVVNVESFGIILYAQIPPYFWAVPAPNCADELTEYDLSLIVSQIATMCSTHEEEFFRDPDAKEWKKTVQKPLLVYPLLNSKCCITVYIK